MGSGQRQMCRLQIAISIIVDRRKLLLASGMRLDASGSLHLVFIDLHTDKYYTHQSQSVSQSITFHIDITVTA